jgi:Ca-activated chloride channel homolog
MHFALSFRSMDFQFEHKDLVLLFAAIPLLIILFIWLLVWKKRARKRMGDANLVNLLVGDFSSGLFTSRFVLISLAFALGAVAAMNPRKPSDTDNVNRKGIDIVIALDVSRSMLATDLAPNRLERARQFMLRLMNDMPDDRIGLIVFAGKAYQQMPLTADHGAAQLFISSANTDAVPQQGTVISDALKMSANAFNPGERRFKTIVLISDGEDHDAEAIRTAEDLATGGVMINTIGVGSPEGTTLTDPDTGGLKKDELGNTVISKLNEDELKQIAAKTNGVYIRLQNSEQAVKALRTQLSQIEKKAYADVSLMNYRTWFMWFAAGMFVLLLLEIFIPEKLRKKKPKALA